MPSPRLFAVFCAIASLRLCVFSSTDDSVPGCISQRLLPTEPLKGLTTSLLFRIAFARTVPLSFCLFSHIANDIFDGAGFENFTLAECIIAFARAELAQKTNGSAYTQFAIEGLNGIPV